MSIRVVFVLVLTFTLALLVFLEVPGVNGPWYWKWTWRHIDALRLFPLTMLGITPLLMAQILYNKRRISATVAILLTMCAMLALELGCIAAQCNPLSLQRVTVIVQSPSATSYFTDALLIAEEYPFGYHSLRSWLCTYPEHLHERHLHTVNKPPGLIIFYWLFIRTLGPGDDAAFAGGLTLGILATLTIPATYFWLKEVCETRDAAFQGASYLALCPSLVLFFPEFDQIYPALTSLILTAWARAITRDAWIYSAIFGFLLGCMLFLTFSFLVLGIFIVGYGLIETARLSQQTKCLAKHCCIATCFFVSVSFAMWLVLGYDPINTFLTAVENQKRCFMTNPRSAAVLTSAFDLLDFALGSAWLSILLGIFFLARTSSGQSRIRPLVFLAMLQFIVVALFGVLPGEAARVWAFMLPLLMIPIGIELNEWKPWPRILLFGCVWLLLTAICQKMTFISP